jgi:hypothetical protein
MGYSQFTCQDQSCLKNLQVRHQQRITEGYGLQFGRRLSNFMNPCSLSDGHLPKLQEMTLLQISSAVVTETQEVMA